MLNENSPISDNSVIALPYSALQKMPSIHNPLPLKFVYYHQTSPHEKLITQAFYQQAIEQCSDWQATAEAVCYRYGIGWDYLDNCLSKVRVFNPNITCVDCGVLYQVTEPAERIIPTSNVYRYVADKGFNQENMYQQSGVYQAATGEWRCRECQAFRLQGNLPQDEVFSF